MDRSSEDALWRSIVENYGERADLDARADPDETPTDAGGSDVLESSGSTDATDTTDTDTDTAETAGTAETADGGDHEAARTQAAAAREREFEARHDVPEQFVPPVPPPFPYVAPSRLLAWAALVGGPLLLLLSLMLGLPRVWQLIAAACFVGGFAYLVVRMPRDPRDPWDDGARV